MKITIASQRKEEVAAIVRVLLDTGKTEQSLASPFVQATVIITIDREVKAIQTFTFEELDIPQPADQPDAFVALVADTLV